MGARPLSLVCALLWQGPGCAKDGIDNVQQSSGLGSDAATSATSIGEASSDTSSDHGDTPGTTESSTTTSTTAGVSDSEPTGSSSSGDDDASSTGVPLPFCGDGNADPGEACDDANADETDACLSSCAAASCGDGFAQVGVEACDDANADETDACLSSCAAASCGDGFAQVGVEACDDTVNDGAYDGCNPGCAALGPHCGDAAVQGPERCDGDTGYANIACTGCNFDFSAITQLYCFGTCSYAGAQGCDQADADVYCRLVRGDPNSVAISFQVVGTQNAPGFACPDNAVNLGAFPEYGVANNVWYEDANVAATHGGGQVVANINCS